MTIYHFFFGYMLFLQIWLAYEMVVNLFDLCFFFLTSFHNS